MNKIRLKSIRDHGIAFDTETWMIDEDLTPPVVCASIGAWDAENGVTGSLLSKAEAIDTFVKIVEDPDAVMLGANLAFDLGVCAKELERMGIDAYPEIFKMFEEERVYDLQLAEALNAIAEGHLGKDPRSGGSLINPDTGKRGRYSLATCVDLVLDRKDAKVNSEWVLKYKELEQIPMESWPEEAKQYPVDDAVNTAETSLAQCGFLPKVRHHHRWSQEGPCSDCQSVLSSDTCWVTEPHRNLHDLAAQVETHFAMHLGANRGFHVNQASVDIIERHALRNKERGIKPFIAAGLVRADGTENRSELKRRGAIAYGASEPCRYCMGSGKVRSPSAKDIRCKACLGKSSPDKDGPAAEKWKAEHPEGCSVCGCTGKIPNPTALINCFSLDVDGETRNKTCDGTGVDLPPSVPRSEREGISYGVDVCHESGDEFLMAYGDYMGSQKILNVYLPYLRKARQPIAGHAEKCDYSKRVKKPICTCEGPYRDIALVLTPNPLLETGRVSYNGVIQLFPRKPGYIDKESGEYVPSLRECIEARTNFEETVLVEDDYVLASGEEWV